MDATRQFEQVLSAVRSVLVARARRTGLSVEDAEDAVQTAAMRTWVRWQAGDVRAECLQQYLLTATHRAAVDLNARRVATEELPADCDPPCTRPLPAAAVGAASGVARLASAMRQMPPGSLESLCLAMEGHGVTARQRINVARRQLESLLADPCCV